ncbi:hypothetical protein ILUMI_26989 [Ignelater luminosus]|uniref:Ras-related protein Rab n=1 Tax=Ignelater luminosus TaxID=2038154 RepID=A0A8K0C3X8_IGNLU|nr:hypothetical protein ILUMI_26989 [Ignelater luminosus]
MIEEVQVRPLKRRTRGERTKRRERYLLHNGTSSCKLEDKSPQRLPSASEIPENNNCLNCRQRLQKAKEKESPPPVVKTKSNLHQSGVKPKDHLYKILVIGDLGTGKTSIIKRYVHQFFSQHYRATIGVDFALKVLNWDANTLIRLQLWDIAGQERYGNMTRVYYKEAVGAFIVFDVTRVNTFESVANWKADLDSKVQLADGSPIPCVLLANKCDQQKEGLVNNKTKMDDYCKEKGFAAWYETSAKENINIDEAARTLVNQILLNDKLINEVNKDGDQFSLASNSNEIKKKSCSC